MEQAVACVGRERVQIEHVGWLVVLDHRADLLVDRVPVDDAEIDLGAALLAVLLGERLPEGPRVVLAVVGDDDGERGPGTALTRDGERGDGRDDGEQTHDAHGHILSATAPGAGGIFDADRKSTRLNSSHVAISY